MKKAVDLSCQGGDVEGFFVKSSRLYKEVNFNEGIKQRTILEAIQ